LPWPSGNYGRHSRWRWAGDATIRATTSLGVAVLPQHAHTRDELIAAADQVAYAAKDAGKDCPSGPPPFVARACVLARTLCPVG